MLELKDVSLCVGNGDGEAQLLRGVHAVFPKNHFSAIIGPSGCGKSTLLKTIAGIAPGEESGEIFWNKRSLEEEDFEPSEIGYVPQFSIAHQELTVFESVECALRLRVGGLSATRRQELATSFLEEVGIEEFSDRRVAVLSGGQQRRLALAMEIASRPHILLCDEVTSGLDPQSEDEIVKLLHTLSKTGDRLILSVTHSLQHLELYDSVMVLVGGYVAYHGTAADLMHYFRVEDPSLLYSQLARRPPEEWGKSWAKHSEHFVAQIKKNAALAATSSLDVDTAFNAPPAICPSAISQFFVLLQRRFLIFSRNVPQLFMQFGLVIGFPLLVAAFAWNGLPNIKNLSMGLDQNVIAQLVEARDFLIQASKVGSLVSGIVMFQVILLTLMGANNAGREVAGERLIFEKEKLSGLSPFSYVASKVAFLAGLVVIQATWMGLFVHFVCGFPGDLGSQIMFLLLVNGAMTSVCLALSSWLANAEQSSLASIYLVGFQLPLSGAVLALPEPLGMMARPFIAAYWSWSGILQTLRGERYYDIVQMVVQSSLSAENLCLIVLLFHIALGVLLTWMGCQRSRME